MFCEDLLLYNSHILLWGRYIDDVLICWDGERALFEDSVSLSNPNQVGMLFTYEIQEHRINFQT